MRTLALLASLLLASPSMAAIVHGTGGSSGHPSSASSVTATLPAVASGSTVIGTVYWSPGQTLTSVKDGSGTVTCTLIGSPLLSAASDYQQQVVKCLNVTNSPTSFVATFSAATAWPTLVVDPFTGVGDVDDSASHGGTASSGTALSSGSFTTVTAGDLIYGSGQNENGGGPVLSAGTGFTLGTSGPSGSGIASEYMVQSAAGAVTATMTSSISDVWTMAGIAFSPSGGGGGNLTVTQPAPSASTTGSCGTPTLTTPSGVATWTFPSCP